MYKIMNEKQYVKQLQRTITELIGDEFLCVFFLLKNLLPVNNWKNKLIIITSNDKKYINSKTVKL